ncbi:MAG: hypothetical protein JWP27_1217 [Flaviaesturariibacter sp.]|nr:hypothetical protein [Flaviaesturariibacter sp.]
MTYPDNNPAPTAISQQAIEQLQSEMRQTLAALVTRYYDAQLLNIENDGYHQLQDRISRHMTILGQEVDTIVWRNRIRA